MRKTAIVGPARPALAHALRAAGADVLETDATSSGLAAAVAHGEPPGAAIILTNPDAIPGAGPWADTFHDVGWDVLLLSDDPGLPARLTLPAATDDATILHRLRLNPPPAAPAAGPAPRIPWLATLPTTLTTTLVIAAKPGAGATLLALALAAETARRAITTALLDPRGDAARTILHPDAPETRAPEPTLLDPGRLAALRGRRRDQPGHSLACGHGSPHDWAVAADDAQRRADSVILDAGPPQGPLWEDCVLPLARAGAWCVVTTVPTLIGWADLRLLCDRLAREGTPRDRVLATPNLLDPATAATLVPDLERLTPPTATPAGHGLFDPGLRDRADRGETLARPGGIWPATAAILTRTHGIDDDRPTTRKRRRP